MTSPLQSIMLHVQQSHTVLSNNPNAFDEAVNRQLANGWVMNGAVFSVGNSLAVNMVKVDQSCIDVARKSMEAARIQLNEMFP